MMMAHLGHEIMGVYFYCSVRILAHLADVALGTTIVWVDGLRSLYVEGTKLSVRETVPASELARPFHTKI